MHSKVLLSIFFLLVCSSLNLHAQCVVDAGDDRNVCYPELLAGPSLNGAIVSGNVVSLAWEAEFVDVNLGGRYSAADMLSDTTVLAPAIVQRFDRSGTYYLRGTTSTNETCVDSVVLNFSDWRFLLLDKATGKPPTDTIELWIAAKGDWPHMRYEWSPNVMISDTTIERPLVWNDTTVFYDLVITDSLGCSITDDIFEVYVNVTSTEEILDRVMEIYPNPTVDLLNVQTDAEVKGLTVYDLQGRVVAIDQGVSIDLSSEKTGTYILQINLQNGEQFYRKVLKD